MKQETYNQVRDYRNRLFPGYDSPLSSTDPEFVEHYDRFAFGVVPASDDLDDRTRLMAIMAALIGCQGLDMFKAMTKGALNVGVTPVEAKEIVYQSTAYVGMGRMLPYLYAVNELLDHRLVAQPLEKQATVEEDERLEAGVQKQVDLFGPQMTDAYQTGPEDTRHIRRWLAENCFGDYYTRTGLTDAQREMITFCFLAAQGGCEPQLVSHAQANMRLGNDRAFLIKVVSQCLPYVGYPRSLNALACIDEACEAMDTEQ
ncbi:carboxymuconolactone decarboxylase family protein [Arabiibacter massiliensis]|uniref:carboxymuconolactone decarboxylase family protein n=1 Tax=Arabiibacter massiliensis TaxID=1870985 RepID=UPI0009BB9708|nr:carboxymuconolactone decarboxylase family protein [Arabiibacter massiliensis]